MTSTLKTLAALFCLLFFAACGSDEMAPPKPCAMWPVTITAGVNDKIDVSTYFAFTATIAAGTYYSPFDLAAAAESALNAAKAPAVMFDAGVDDKLDFTVGGVPYVASLSTGVVYKLDGIGTLVSWDVDRALDASVSNGWVVTIEGGKIRIAGAAAWAPKGATGANAARSAWRTLGFGSVDYAEDSANRLAAGVPEVLMWHVTIDSVGRIVISQDGYPFILKFGTGANAASSARGVLGFDSADTAATLSVTAARQIESCWFGADPVAFDSYDRPVSIRRAQTRALSGKVRTRTFATQYERSIDLAFLPPYKVFISEEGTDHVNEALERLFVSGAARFRWFPDASDLATYADYALDAGTKFDPRRLSAGADLYSQTLRMLRYV